MIDQNSLKEFIGAKVQVKNLLDEGEIVTEPIVDEDLDIIVDVLCNSDKPKKYTLCSVKFNDASLQQKADDICAQLIAIKGLISKNKKDEKMESITIGGRTSKIGSNYHPEFMTTKPVLTLNEVEEDLGVHTLHFKGISYSQASINIVIVSVLKESVDHFVYDDYWDENGESIQVKVALAIKSLRKVMQPYEMQKVMEKTYVCL